jgi:hypothetical protein
MRKQTRRPISSSKSPKKRALRLSLETVRKLTSEELSQVVTGCPTGSETTYHQNGGSNGC